MIWILECRFGSSVTGQNRCLAFPIPDELESAWSSPIWQRICTSVNKKLQGVNSMLRATRSRNPFARGKSFDSWTKLSSPSTATSCYRKGERLNRPWLGSYHSALQYTLDRSLPLQRLGYPNLTKVGYIPASFIQILYFHHSGRSILY